MKPALASLAFMAVSLMSDVALACSVCFSSNDKNRIAYTITFVFLTTLPLAFIGGALLYLRKRAREQARQD